jgi:cytochrome bd-type quinol oxidase subunit 2
MANVTTPPIKRSSAAFLQVVIVLIGVGALALLLWEPHLEGRNARATPVEIYFKDPFLAYVYVASIPFFVALYQAFKVLGYAGRNRVFSQEAVNALRTIKYCALAVIGFVAVSVVFMIWAGRDDRPAGVFMRVLVAFPSIVVAAAAAMFERILQNAVDLKSENELTV